MKKIVFKLIICFLFIVFLITGCSCFHVNKHNNKSLVFVMGKYNYSKEDPGVYFTLPFVGSNKPLFTGDRLYDVKTTSATTSDKKSMEVNAFIIWRIEDPLQYYRNMNSIASAEGRIEGDLFSAMKKVISSLPQHALISGKDGSISQEISERVNFHPYGISLVNFDIKTLDLPKENKEAVYQRMISERNKISATYKAEGEKEASKIRSTATASAREMISNAEALSAETIAEGERTYYQILREAYSASEDKAEFYKFYNELDALDTALENGGTIIIDEDNPLYQILIDNQ